MLVCRVGQWLCGLLGHQMPLREWRATSPFLGYWWQCQRCGWRTGDKRPSEPPAGVVAITDMTIGEVQAAVEKWSAEQKPLSFRDRLWLKEQLHG